MTKPKLLFASALKPALDIRHKKLSQGLQEDFDIHYCGIKTDEKSTNQKTHQWIYKKGILKRIIIRKSYNDVLEKVKPQIIILSTLELAPTSLRYVQNNKATLIYDVQENVALNLKFQENHSIWKKWLFEKFQQKWEPKLISKSALCILAESCYKDEMSFNDTPTVTIENKADNHPIKTHYNRIPNKYCFTGTLSKNSGILKATKWFLQNTNQNDTTLEIIGHAVNQDIHQKLKKLSQQHKTIIYKGSRSPIPYQNILETIYSSSFGIMSYKISPANKNKLPTKLFEYCAHQLPIISITDGKWNKYILKYNAGITTKKQFNIN